MVGVEQWRASIGLYHSSSYRRIRGKRQLAPITVYQLLVMAVHVLAVILVELLTHAPLFIIQIVINGYSLHKGGLIRIIAFKKRTSGTRLLVSVCALGLAVMEAHSSSLERSARAMAILLIMAGDVEQNPGPLPPASASPESRALHHHSASLITAIADPLMLSLKLFSAGIIDKVTKDKANLPIMNIIEKKNVLLLAVKSEVDTDPSLFHRFVDLLKDDRDDNLKSLGGKLEDTYNEFIKGDTELCTLSPPPNHTGLQPSSSATQPSHSPSSQSPPPHLHRLQPGISRESRALSYYSASLITAITDPLELSWQLLSAGIIDMATKNKANLPTMTTTMKNDVLLLAIMSKVDTDPSLFHRFVDILKDDGDDILRSLGGKLEDTCNEFIKGDTELCTLSSPPNHTGLQPSSSATQPSHSPPLQFPPPYLHHLQPGISRESSALSYHSASLFIGIAYPLELSWKLLFAGIIDMTTKDKANLPTMTTFDKNDVLLSAVMSGVDTDSSLFHKFVDLLKDDKDRILQSLGGKLEDTYSSLSKEILQDALKEGFVVLRIIKLLLVGPAGSGKTCLKNLLLGKEPPLFRTSTPCAEKPVRAVSWTRFEMTQKGWREVSQEEFLAMVADAVHLVYEGLPARSGTREELLPVLQTLESGDHNSTRGWDYSSTGGRDHGSAEGRDENSTGRKDHSNTGGRDCSNTEGEDHNNTRKEGHSNTGSIPPIFSEHATQNTLQCVLDRIKRGFKSEELMEVDWIHFVDSGGQPAFQELLPIFSLNTSVIACVHRLLERLDEHPTIKYYKDGNLVGEPHSSPLTNEEILHCMVQSIQSQHGNPPNVIIVGTHRDCEGKCTETRQEKNDKLHKLLCPHIRDQLIFKPGLEELIFAFNTEKPEEEDKKTAVEFQSTIEDLIVDPVEIPIWWYILESILQELAKIKGSRVLSEHECFIIALQLKFNEKSFTTALEFLHNLNIIYYQPLILPGIVFSDSQVPLDKVTELVEESYRLRGHTIVAGSQAKQTRPVAGIWMKFRDQGIITAEFLKAFPSHYIPGLFAPQHLLKLLEGLLIAAPIDSIEYFMPCLLDVLPPKNLETYRQTSQEVTPLLICFPGSCPQKGVFCCLVVYLLNYCKWKLVLPGGDLIKVSRNCVKFRHNNLPCSITLIDTFTYFEVHVNAPLGICKKVCPIIRDSIIQGISVALKNLHYDESEIHTAFFCPHVTRYTESTASASVDCHMATLATLDEDQYWMCSKDADMMDELTPAQRMWFSGITTQSAAPTAPKPQSPLQATPEVSDLLEKVATIIPAKWRKVGLMLGLQPATLRRIEAENPTLDCIDCYTSVFDTWRRRNVTGCTWEAVIKALKSATVDEESLATEIENKLSGH